MADRIFLRKPTDSELEAGPVRDEIISFDAVLTETHDKSARVTSNPIELGADVNDHVILEPVKLLIRGGTTDSPLGFAALGQIIDTITGLFGSSTEANLTRSQEFYRTISDLMEERRPIGVQTGLLTYNNMVITNITTSQDKDTSSIAIMDISLQEAIIVTSEVVILEPTALGESTKEGAEPLVDQGRKDATPVTGNTNTSTLHSIGSSLGVF